MADVMIKSPQIAKSQLDDALTRLVYARNGRLGRVVRLILELLGVQIPKPVPVGPGLQLVHATAGLVVHREATIGDRVVLFHGVTIGRGDPWVPVELRGRSVVEVQDDVIIGTGAVVLADSGQRLVVGRGTIVGANAVLTCSTGEWEVWAGIPARKVGDRPRD